jgi:hypothetical protein
MIDNHPLVTNIHYINLTLSTICLFSVIRWIYVIQLVGCYHKYIYDMVVVPCNLIIIVMDCMPSEQEWYNK